MKKQMKPTRKPESREDCANTAAPGLRHISLEKHKEIKRKVLAVHDGLLRKLAEHDRQR